MSHDECLALTDGRRLAWWRYGDAGGSPLYVLHGLPGSRLQATALQGTFFLLRVLAGLHVRPAAGIAAA
jgi:hypothetical protein